MHHRPEASILPSRLVRVPPFGAFARVVLLAPFAAPAQFVRERASVEAATETVAARNTAGRPVRTEDRSLELLDVGEDMPGSRTEPIRWASKSSCFYAMTFEATLDLGVRAGLLHVEPRRPRPTHGPRFIPPDPVTAMKRAKQLARSLVLLAFATALAAQTQQQQPPGFTEKVEVNVRTVLAIVTDAKGKPIERPLTVEDVEVLEDGIPAKVLGVDAVRPAKRAGSTAGKASLRKEVPPAAPPEVIARVPQILYLDASLLQKQSVKKVCEMTAKNLDPLLSRGPLEIVLADPEPQTVLPSTADPGPIRGALASLAKSAYGRNRLLDVRADFIPASASLKNTGGDLDANMRRIHARISMQEEIHLIRQSLERLGKWAGLRADRSPAVLYLANDGFDLVLSDFYRNYLNGTDGEQIRMEFASQIPSMVATTQNLLANQGLMTIPLAIGGSEAFFANSASEVGKRPLSELRNPVSDAPTFLFARPLDSLRQIADATGGEVVTREDHFVLALDRLSNAVAITYRMERPPDGKVHKLEVRARREGVVLRTAHSVVAGTSEAAAAARSIEALTKPVPAGNLPIQVSVDLVEVKKNKRRVGELRVSADLAEIAGALEKVGPGRIRVTLAVEAKGSKPFVHHDEMDISRDDTGTTWLYDAPFEWPPEAQRVAVTVEELKTGAHGTAVAELPAPGPETESPKPQPGLFQGAPAGPELPLEVTFSSVRRSVSSVSARLHAKIGIEPILDALSKKGRGRVRVTILSESPAGRREIVNVERSVLFDITVDNWTLEIPVSWSVNTMRLIVTIVEAESGARAVATIDPTKLE